MLPIRSCSGFMCSTSLPLREGDELRVSLQPFAAPSSCWIIPTITQKALCDAEELEILIAPSSEMQAEGQDSDPVLYGHRKCWGPGNIRETGTGEECVDDRHASSVPVHTLFPMRWRSQE